MAAGRKDEPQQTVVVGTAGHVDHGKSALVRAITGTDPDRLKEEQERGITIDLGFAHASAGGVVLSFVDVPGHERFVKNMLAGAGGLDVVLLVVAADESVMPQTREHLHVCRLLGLTTGVVALTKADLVDEETLDLVRLEVADLVSGTFLEDAPVIACSSVTRRGLDEVVAALEDAARRAPTRRAAGPFRMPVDRAFTMRGFGTVVTGTALGGAVRTGDEVELLPAGRRGRVRSVQVHGAPAEVGEAGHRVALNLASVDHDQVERGDVVVTPGSMSASRLLDVVVTLLDDAPDLEDLARVRLHVGTAEVMARVRWALGKPAPPGGRAVAQLRLEAPVVAAAGDRFVLRRYSPVSTIGGGRVLHPHPRAVLRRGSQAQAAALERMAAALEDDDLADLLVSFVESAGSQGASDAELAAWMGNEPAAVRGPLAGAAVTDRAVRVGDGPARWFSPAAMATAERRVEERLRELHAQEPLVVAHSKQALLGVAGLPEAAFLTMLARGEASGRWRLVRDQVALAGHEVKLAPDEEAARRTLVSMLESGGLQPPDLDVIAERVSLDRDRLGRLVRLLAGAGEVVKLKEGMLVHGAAMVRLLQDMASWYQPGEPFSVPDFKERSGVSRKHAIPLLEYLDSQGHTRRVGEGRVWTGRSRSGASAAAPPTAPAE